MYIYQNLEKYLQFALLFLFCVSTVVSLKNEDPFNYLLEWQFGDRSLESKINNSPLTGGSCKEVRTYKSVHTKTLFSLWNHFPAEPN